MSYPTATSTESELLELVKGTNLQIQTSRVSMIHDNSIYKKSHSESPLLEVQQKPEAWSQTKNSRP